MPLCYTVLSESFVAFLTKNHFGVLLENLSLSNLYSYFPINRLLVMHFFYDTFCYSLFRTVISLSCVPGVGAAITCYSIVSLAGFTCMRSVNT